MSLLDMLSQGCFGEEAHRTLIAEEGMVAVLCDCIWPTVSDTNMFLKAINICKHLWAIVAVKGRNAAELHHWVCMVFVRFSDVFIQVV